MTITFFGGTHAYGLVSLANVADQEGIADATAYVPASATSLIIVASHGYTSTPSAPQTVSGRIMPFGYNSFSPVLFRSASVHSVGGTIPGVGFQNDNIQMPVYNGIRKLYWALRSSDPTVANKGFDITLIGYES